jgi:solute:Na+ symporter, SSS family
MAGGVGGKAREGLPIPSMLPIACGVMIKKVGGTTDILNELDIFNSYKTKEDVIFSFSTLLYLIIPSISAPYLQRVLAIRSATQVVKSFKYVAALTFVYSCIIIVMGTTLRANVDAIQPENGLYYIINHYLTSHAIRGIMISAVFAVIMSTADSWLNISGSVIAHDMAKRIFPRINKRQELLIARLSTVLVVALALTFSLNSNQIMEKLWLVRNFWHPVVLIPLLAGILGIKAAKGSFIYSMIFGSSFTLIGYVLTSGFGIVSMMLGTTASAIGFFLYNYAVNNEKTSKSFYK